jgi:hypothetical protein
MPIDLIIAGVPFASYAYVLWLTREVKPGLHGPLPRA